MDIIWTIIGALFAGLIIGPLARLVLPGKQDISLPATIGMGAVGALVGGLAADLIGVGETRGIDWIQFFLEIAAAAIAVSVFISFRKR